MAITEPVKEHPLQPECSEVDDTTCPPYDISSSQPPPLLGNPEDFDIEAQQPSRYQSGLGDGQGNAAASTEEMRLQVFIQKLCYLPLYLLFGSLGLLAVFIVIIVIGAVLFKFAMAAVWILEKVGLI
ncbi:hypothetical protein DL770_005398 [Monosporascus sp. CRB-9-2]|nr:hypothetical protein DL770_005398 [Monosporascus sp. CRB-9-2]